MTDHDDDLSAAPGEPGGSAESAESAQRPAPRPTTPGAHAASRARRIGGRPPGGARPAGADLAPPADVTEPATEPADVTEPAELVDAGLAGAAEAEPTDAPPRRADRRAERKAQRKAAAKAGKADAKAEQKAEQKADRELAKDDAAGRPLLVRLGWWPAAVGAVLVAGMLGVGVWQSHGVWWAKGSTAADREQVRTQVLAVAKGCGAAVTSYDYRSFAASEQAGLRCTTGDFTTQYRSAMEQTVKSLATQSQTVQTTQVAKAGITQVSADGKQWVILVYGQQTVSNKDTVANSPRLDVLSMQVTIDKVGGAWLIANIQTVS
jgi:Mce-associated membrane protein